MSAFNIGIQEIKTLNSVDLDVTEVLNRYFEIFDGGLGKFNKSLVLLKLKPGSVTKFFKPRQIRLPIKEKVEAEIGKLVKMGVLEPTTFSEWGTPIVPILKKSGEVRICGDYKVTLNPQLHVYQYPLLRIEELFAKLQGGREFSKLDLSMAYQQLVLDNKSKQLTTISTTKGLLNTIDYSMELLQHPHGEKSTLERFL